MIRTVTDLTEGHVVSPCSLCTNAAGNVINLLESGSFPGVFADAQGASGNISGQAVSNHSLCAGNIGNGIINFLQLQGLTLTLGVGELGELQPLEGSLVSMQVYSSPVHIMPELVMHGPD